MKAGWKSRRTREISAAAEFGIHRRQPRHALVAHRELSRSQPHRSFLLVADAVIDSKSSQGQLSSGCFTAVLPPITVTMTTTGAKDPPVLRILLVEDNEHDAELLIASIE